MKPKFIVLTLLFTIFKGGQFYPANYNSFYRNYWHKPSNNWFSPSRWHDWWYNNPTRQPTSSTKPTMMPRGARTNADMARTVAPRKVKNGFDAVPWFFQSYRRPIPSSHCREGYYSDGHRCKDVDECKSSPPVCGKNSVCTNYMGTYRCHCNTGYCGSPPRVPCVDIDECSTGVHRCYKNSVCKNYKGGYWCDCSVLGYTWDGQACICKEGFNIEDDGRCVDIDECNEGDHETICGEHTDCTNIAGSYQCRCKEGYHGNPPDTPCRDLNSRCTNINGTVSCLCNPGYTRNSVSDLCEDVDECTEQVCGEHGVCVNTPGSHQCSCSPGFVGYPPDFPCKDVDECLTVTCGENSVCVNSVGSYDCSCKEGFENIDMSGCTDVDECSNTGVCGDNTRCINVEGSYRCVCAEGFTLDPFDGGCIELNECLSRKDVCGPHSYCESTSGNFSCHCLPGFFGSPPSTPCAPEFPSCDCGKNSYCEKFEGSYRCTCKPGFQGSHPEIACEDKNECEEDPDICGPSASCVNEVGSYKCLCNPGFQGPPCVDVNECMSTDCGPDAVCINTEGSFVCSCVPGYEGSPPREPCREISRDWREEKSLGVPGTEDCSKDVDICGENTACVGGSCKCVDGYHGNPLLGCTDINECEEGASCGLYAVCINTEGGYHCQCVAGFAGTPPTIPCEDVDECQEQVGVCGENEDCLNTIGRYTCTPKSKCDIECGEHASCLTVGTLSTCICQLGYEGHPPLIPCTKEGLDHCPDNCGDNAACVKRGASFSCVCRNGYSGHPPDTPCIDVDECLSPVCGEHGSCQNSVGSYSCKCDTGYEGIPCTDVDECLSDPIGLCGKNTVCQNTQGSYLCKCQVGYDGHPPQSRCRDVNECARGKDICGKTAQCKNTLGGYECICQEGFIAAEPGGECEDIDECLEDVCEEGRVCVNTAPGYRCACPPGQVDDIEGVCVPGVGVSCTSDEDCTTHAVCYSCCDTTCHCMQGYKEEGETCKDIDECSQGLSTCGDNTVCYNFEGGYNCTCSEGFSGNPPSIPCTDHSSQLVKTISK